MKRGLWMWEGTKGKVYCNADFMKDVEALGDHGIILCDDEELGTAQSARDSTNHYNGGENEFNRIVGLIKELARVSPDPSYNAQYFDEESKVKVTKKRCVRRRKKQAGKAEGEGE